MKERMTEINKERKKKHCWKEKYKKTGERREKRGRGRTENKDCCRVEGEKAGG